MNADATITATAPAGSGTVVVAVTTTPGTSSTTARALASINCLWDSAPGDVGQPEYRAQCGGTSVTTCSGIGFTTATAVMFGNVAATSFTVNGDTFDHGHLSGLGGGAAVISVIKDALGIVQHSRQRRRRQSVPGLRTERGLGESQSQCTNNTVTLTGSGFTGATGVSFGSIAGSNIVVNSDTSLTVRQPSLTRGNSRRARYHRDLAAGSSSGIAAGVGVNQLFTQTTSKP